LPVGFAQSRVINSMLITAEMRWFHPGQIPADIRGWFESDCPGKLETPPPREDLYLCVPGCEFLNLKHRQGRLELKWRREDLGVWKVSPKWEGRAQIWIKWPCDDPQAERMIPPEVREMKTWIAVEKARSLRSHSLDGGTSGGTLELSQLHVQNRDWWSVSLEVYGPEERLPEILDAIAATVSRDYSGPPLTLAHSYPYPTLLLRVGSRE